MNRIQNQFVETTKRFLKDSYNISEIAIEISTTKKEFEGDYTIVLFPFLKPTGKSSNDLGTELGNFLRAQCSEVKDFNIVKGFLNLSLYHSYFSKRLKHISDSPNYGFAKEDNQPAVMVEYSSPNTNKPLHLGHVRNNLIGHALSEILKASGRKVIKTQVVNDRGIHICKSMVAWQKFGEGKTPESEQRKGDHFVGDYYIGFDIAYKKEVSDLVEKGFKKEEAEQKAPILLEAQELLRKWEQKDPETLNLWETMNSWVYEGFDYTYNQLGVTFDKSYYESNTYLMGKQQIQEGVEQGLLYQKEDGSIWADLTEYGLDEKVLQRSDGTSVYMTQDVGMAIKRFQEFDIDELVYTVGNEQDYHFQALFAILKKMSYPWAERLFHLSYGMVALPTGKMKSREGTVVDADQLMEEMQEKAASIASELGKLEGYSEEEKQHFYKIVGLGAIKYQILKVDPKKPILFNPKRSVDFHGNTAPFIQYTYARIQSILRGYVNKPMVFSDSVEMTDKETALIKLIDSVPDMIKRAVSSYNPSIIANYCYEVAQEYNSYYQDTSILNPNEENLKPFRVTLSKTVGNTIKNIFHLLGIETPERM